MKCRSQSTFMVVTTCALAALAAVAGLIVIRPLSAHAGTMPAACQELKPGCFVNTDGRDANLRWNPTVNTSITGHAANKSPVIIACTARGTWVTGRDGVSTNLWDFILVKLPKNTSGNNETPAATISESDKFKGAPPGSLGLAGRTGDYISDALVYTGISAPVAHTCKVSGNLVS